MNWNELIGLARQLVAAPPSARLRKTQLRLAVGAAYYAAYHALARSNADLLIGASETERRLPESRDVCMALGGDCVDQRLQDDFSSYPEDIRRFVDTLLALHQQRLLAEEDPETEYTVDDAEAWIEGAETAIMAFVSVDPAQRRSLAVRGLLQRPTA